MAIADVYPHFLVFNLGLTTEFEGTEKEGLLGVNFEEAIMKSRILQNLFKLRSRGVCH
jgi:hypothetical protein